MPLSKVHDVNVIADAGPIGCGVITPEHAQALPLSQSHLLHKQNVCSENEL